MTNRLDTDNWQTLAQHKSKIWFDNSLISNVDRSWFEPKFWQNNNAVTGESKGRYTTYFVATESNQGTPLELVLRHYYRGGLVGKISKDSFIFTGYKNARAYKELALLNKMLQMGLPVPRPIAARVYLSKPWLCHNDILIERIDQSQDLFHYLTKQALTEEQWRNVGSTIKQFHQHGVYHSDLNIHNILIDDQDKIWLIDFDRCEFREQNNQWQQANLDRLKRSLLKEHSLNANFHYLEENWQQLVAGYQQ